MKYVYTVIGRLIFAAITCLIVVIIAGGKDFLSQPLGMVYLALLFLWMATIAIGRKAGVRSAYDSRQCGIYALLAVIYSVVLFAVPWEYAHFSGPIPRDGLLAWAGLIVFALGIFFRSWAVWALRGFYTARLGIQPGHRLITAGPYELVRHPGYLGEIASVLGMSLALSSLIGLAMTILLFPLLIWRIGTEEEMLLVQFGEEYREYMRRTKRLIPGIC
ncbi:MAG TPA: isoprenylcysteine carboxylmethyltransferase family protein [Methanotrichaceae archaeon]|nr:isoprenylcysteine carboxylmethyltransferase family protein [Methanotrichaceae archaeon]